MHRDEVCDVAIDCCFIQGSLPFLKLSVISFPSAIIHVHADISQLRWHLSYKYAEVANAVSIETTSSVIRCVLEDTEEKK
jgi:hypothetical protein